jgi:hypothetical protein
MTCTEVSAEVKIALDRVGGSKIPVPHNYAGKSLRYVGRSLSGRQYLHNLRVLYPLPSDESHPDYLFAKNLREYLRLTE